MFNRQWPLSKKNVACAFSGGVDSFYTLWSHIPQNEPYADYRLTHAIFIQGFDIPLTDELTFTITRKEYALLMRKLGLSLVVAKTNVRHYAQPIGWEFSHGAALIAVALVLQGGLSRFYTPGPRTYRYTDLRPVGLHPVLDHLLSTEALDVIHDGASVDRFNKTAIIAKWPETYDRLRVCWVKPDGLRNCCRCNKCLWTMATLQLFGVLDRYATFPLPLDRSRLRRCFFKKEIQRIYARQILQRAKEFRRVGLAFDLRCALAHTWWRRRLRSFKRNL
jgi:hypothetical protein